MNIKMIHKNEGAAIENADGYLVQEESTGPLRLGECVFVKDLNSLVKSVEDLNSYAFGFRVPEGKDAELDKAISFLHDKRCYVWHRETSPDNYYVSAARTMKVWPLNDGQHLEKALTINLTADHRLLTSRDYRTFCDGIEAEFASRFPDFQ